MTISEKVSRRNRHQGRSPLEGLRWTITTTQKIAVIRNAISTLSLLFVAAENGAVDVCRYLLARSRFSSFFHKNFIITWSWYSPIILKRISVCHPGLVSRLTSPPTTGSAHFLRPRSEHSVFFFTFYGCAVKPMTIAYISHSNCDKLDSVVKCQPEIATQMMESVCFLSDPSPSIGNACQ